MSAARGWLERAACREVDPELFFPPTELGPVREQQVAAAKAVCAGCPVRDVCLGFALEALTDGVAGGLDADERRAVRRTRPAIVRAPAGPAAHARRGRAAGRSVAALAVELGVSPRTVERWTRVGAA